MNKKSVLWIILDLIFLAVFNTIFFVAGGLEHIASVWISYGFIHFSYVMVLLTPLLIRKSSRSAVFGFSIYSISSAYFFAEFVTGLIFIFCKIESYKATLLVQVILAGIYGILLVANLISNEATADAVEVHEDEVAYIKSACSNVKSLLRKSDNKRANQLIEKTYDLLHSSPTKSNPQVMGIESEISTRVAALGNAVHARDNAQIEELCCEICELIEQRNSKLRLAN